LEGVAIVEDELAVGRDMGGSRDCGNDGLRAGFVADVAAPERGAEDAFLDPFLAGGEFAVGRQTGQLRAGSRAAR
jgi:hypothetical protein